MIHFFVLLPKASKLGMNFKIMKFAWQLPCEQRFFPCMAFSVYEVIRVACLSRSWFLTGSKQTNYARDNPREWLRKRQKPCKGKTPARRVSVSRSNCLSFRKIFASRDWKAGEKNGACHIKIGLLASCCSYMCTLPLPRNGKLIK